VPDAEREYASRFANWDQQAWVRSKPHRVVPFEAHLKFFSPDLSLLLRHTDVSSSPAWVIDEILIHNLYTYLEFTVRLEMGPVNEVCVLLRTPNFLPWLPPAMKDDALRIYTDEAGHAEMSHALINAVQDATKVVPIHQEPQFLRLLSRLYNEELGLYQPFIKLFFVIVSETLITGTLTRLPKDELVQPAVRELAADHASDEGRHHAYFKQLFDYLWRRMPEPLQTKLGMLLPRIILAFLSPDEAALTKILASYPAIFQDPRRIVTDLAGDPTTRQGILDAAAPTLRMLSQNGVFGNQAIQATFEQHSLLPQGART
jgi:hypothetical protein